VPFHPNHISRLEKSGDFPQRVKIGKHRVAWVAQEVNQWIEEKISQRATVPNKDLKDVV
jgi:prophage regulatory protein